MDAKARCTARAGVGAAVCVVLLYLGSLLPGVKLALLCASAFGVGLVRMACSRGWGLGCYAAAALLALLLLPEKSLGLLFAAFFGYYPLLMLDTERIAPPLLRWGARLLCFNGVMIALYFLARSVFTTLLPAYAAMPLALLALGNLGFLVFDWALRQMILYFMRKLEGRIR